MYTHANKTKNQGWIYWGGGGGVLFFMIKQKRQNEIQ